MKPTTWLWKNTCLQRRGDHPGQPLLPIKRLTPKELKERQEKGICIKCNEKYGPGYRCKKLFMIEAYLREDEDEDVMTQDEEDDTPKISFHAIIGRTHPKPWRFMRGLGDQFF